MTIKVKPNLVRTDKTDDIQSISSVEQMYNTFVKPIDQNIRSFQNSSGMGTVSQNERTDRSEQEQFASQALSGGSIDVLRYNESRCHAFYRNVGFPVVAPDGTFFNPGHDPKQSETIAHRTAVKNKIYSSSANFILTAERETQFYDRRDIFARQDEVASVYALLLRKTRPFLSAQTGKDPFFIDEQRTPIDSRKQELNDLNITSTIPDIITNVPHILKPFVVDPVIELAVMPEQSRRVAVPFLGSPKELITGKDEGGSDIKVSRPILEQIIINRLQVKEIDDTFIKSAKYILDNKTSAETSDEIKYTLLAISGKDSLENVGTEVIETIQDFTTLEVAIVNTLIKGIKVAVLELIASVQVLEYLRAKSNLQPIVGTNGPEFPQNGKIKTSGGLTDTSETRQKIALMQLKELVNNRLNSKQDSRVGDNSYVSGISVDLTKNLTNPIDNLKKEEDEIARRALNYLATIEKITGEIAGIGIVDILAIYTALYTIDMKYLIGFLDNNSLTRLDENFHELVNNEVFTQLAGNRPPILDCLKEFEKIFFNILAFADSLIIITSQTPIKARKGSIRGT